MVKEFAEMESIFGEPKAEWSAAAAPALSKPFLFHLHAVDNGGRVRVHVTDFGSSTWEAVRSVQQLEDMRDNIGIAGSWSEFVDYFISSIKSGDVKLVMEGQSTADGPSFAKLVAQKAKGLPLISVSLTKLVGAAASEAMANLSLELHKAYKSKHNLLIEEQESRYQLTRMISAEQEKNEAIQKQLDELVYSKRHKSQKMNDMVTSDTSTATTLHDHSDKQTSSNVSSMKGGNRVVPAYRRAKVRGVLLQDVEDIPDD